ncbi:hypothetical protein KKF55_06810 [Patescibacteria group bacterium]|nr:hypothetical protein [Patescibacteria group bacterium]
MTVTALYIVHSPPPETSDWGIDGLPLVDKMAIHMGQITKALRIALRNNMPIFIETLGGPTDRVEKFLEENGVQKDRVRFVHVAEVKNPILWEQIFNGQKIDRFVVAGHYKEMCCPRSLEAIGKVYLKAEIIILKGDATMSLRNDRKMPGHAFEEHKPRFKEMRTMIGFKTLPLRKAMR